MRYFGPTLDALRALNNSAKPAEVVDWIAHAMKLSDSEITAVTSTGQSKFNKDVHFARFYLSKVDLIDGSERGVWRLTETGQKTKLDESSARDLFHHVHGIFVADKFQNVLSDNDASGNVSQIEDAEVANSHRARVASILRSLTPTGFENFCALLLRKASFTEVKVTGKTGDGGIDGFGFLLINPMMTLRVLFQCKRYTSGPVPKDDIMKFQAAVVRERADKGLFLTTSLFSQPARDEASRGACQIELFDIERIIDLIEQLELGVTARRAYTVDEEFFREFGPNSA